MNYSPSQVNYFALKIIVINVHTEEQRTDVEKDRVEELFKRKLALAEEMEELVRTGKYRNW